MNNNSKPVVVGIGEILWDMLPGGKRAGGAPINFVYHAAALGAEGYAVSAVGNDDDGRDIIAELKNNKIGHIIAHTAYPTGKVLVELKNGIPAYTFVENVAWDHIPYSDDASAVIRRADAVCFGTLASRNPESRDTLIRLLQEAPADALRFFDINLRGRYYSPELIRKFLEFANIFKLNDDEMREIRHIFDLTGNDDEICRKLLERHNLKYLIFTAGDRYSIIYSATETSRLETPKVDVADTVGAGDAFSGAFVYGILTGKSMADAHKNAVRVAAFVCTRSGAWPQYPADMKG